jgi:hypothetical protein
MNPSGYQHLDKGYPRCRAVPGSQWDPGIPENQRSFGEPSSAAVEGWSIR